MGKNVVNEKKKIDWMITLVPLAIVITLSVVFFFVPEQSNAVLSKIRFFFGDTLGTYYLIIGLGIFVLSLYIASNCSFVHFVILSTSICFFNILNYCS